MILSSDESSSIITKWRDARAQTNISCIMCQRQWFDKTGTCRTDGVDDTPLPNRIWWLYESYLVEWYKQLVLPIDPRVSDQSNIYTNVQEITHSGVCKNNWGAQSKRVFKMCEGISCPSFYVKEFDVIVHKKYFPCITLLNVWPFCTPNH